jgi:cell wall-associated NlpC family hydrolase
MYKQRPVELLDVVLATKSFSSMVDQLNMLDRVGTSASTTINSIASYQKTIVATQKRLVTDRTAAERLVAQRAADKAGVESALASRQSMLRGVKAQIAQLQSAQAAAARRAAQRSGAYVPPPGGPVNPDHSSVVAFAASYVGKVPYVWGGSTPAGFDCSGFTMYVYSNFGVSLPHNAAAQQSMCADVTGSEQPGDLVFFGRPAYHVGIYAGGGSMIDAPCTGRMVSYDSVANATSFGRP